MVKKSVLKSAALTVALAAAFSFMPAAQAEVPFSLQMTQAHKPCCLTSLNLLKKTAKVS